MPCVARENTHESPGTEAPWKILECQMVVCSMQMYLGPHLEIVSSILTNHEGISISCCHPETASWMNSHVKSMFAQVIGCWLSGPVLLAVWTGIFLLRSGPDPDVVSPRCSGYGTLYREVIRLRNMVLSKLIFSFTGLFFLSSSLFHDFVCCWYRIWRETRETDWNETHHFSRMDWMSFLVVPSYLMSLGVKPDHFFHVGTNVWSPWTCEFPIIWVIFCGTQAKFQLLIGDSEFTMWHNGASLVCFFIFLVSPVHLPGCAFLRDDVHVKDFGDHPLLDFVNFVSSFVFSWCRGHLHETWLRMFKLPDWKLRSSCWALFSRWIFLFQLS